MNNCLENTNLCSACDFETKDKSAEFLFTKLKEEICLLCKTSSAKLLLQDEKIAELCVFIKNNLTNSLKELIIDMKFNGELEQVINEVALSELTELKLKTEGYVTPKLYGAVGNGVADDSAAIQKAIDSVSGGGVVDIPLSESLYLLKSPINITGMNVVIRNGRFNCEGLESVFNVTKGSIFITFENCYFYRGNQIIRLFECANVTVKNCVFEETGYGVIQSAGSVSNNVNVLNNRCINLDKDFVECNCTKTAPSYNWVITGNTYTHKEIPTTKSTEQRFIGITAVENVIISNNIVEHVKGDSCVHLEDVGGKVIIEGNIFKDSFGFGYIFIMHELHDTIINGNHFINTLSNNTETRFIYVWNGEGAKGDVIVSNNMFDGIENMQPFTCGYNTVFTGNRFKGFGTFLPKTCENVKFVNNYIECDKFCYIDKGVSNAMIKNASFKNNTITGEIHLLHNNTGSQFSNNVTFDGNDINGNVNIKDCKNIFFANNVIKNGCSLTFNSESYYSENMVAVNNFIQGVGLTDNK